MTAPWMLAFPRQIGSIETRPQAFLRSTRTGNTASNIDLEFRAIMRSGTCRRLTHLRPYKFRWIQLRRTGWKPMHVETGMTRQKLCNHFVFMNRMLVPDHDNRTVHLTKQLLQKQNDFRSRQRLPIRSQMQLDFVRGGGQAPCANQVQALVMFDAGPQHRRLPAPCPRAFERRDQRKPAFIEKNQGRFTLTPLFLSVARRCVSNAGSPRRRGPTVAAGVSANSSPYVARAATRRWTRSAHRTTPRSHAQYDRPSNSLVDSHVHRLLGQGLFPTGGVAWRKDTLDAPGRVWLSSAGADALPAANGAHYVPSRRCTAPPPQNQLPVRGGRRHVDERRHVVDWFHRVLCPIMVHERPPWTLISQESISAMWI